MKKLLLIVAVFIASGTYAQKEDSLERPGSYKVNAADSVKGDPESMTFTFSGNVDFESGKLKIKADEVLLDQKTNSIVATGLKDMKFDGKVVFAKGSKRHVLRYAIGDKTVFVE
ncbi:MAG TPA: LptA/OstA family protein [Sphingobacteriaceae bacterium]